MYRLSVRRFLFGAVVAIANAVPSTAQTAAPPPTFAPMSLRVLNGAAQLRTAEPVVCGFPVAETANITSVSLFRIKDPNGTPIPSQFRALTRWSGDRTDGSKKLRWVQAAFLATVAPSSFADYTVEYGTAPPAGSLVVIPGSSSIEVRNGLGGTFVVKATSYFAPFKVVEINGQTLLNSGLGNGAIEMTSSAGTTVTAVPTSTVVEQTGTVMCVVKQTGTLGSLKYTCRWRFFAGRFDPETEFRLENASAYGLFSSTIPDGQVYFDKLWLMQPFAGTSPTVTSTTATHVPTATAPWQVQQDFAWTSVPTNVLGGFNYTESLGAATAGTGGRYPGAFDFKSTAGGVSIGVEGFWENFPKHLKASATQLRVGLWPEWSSGPAYGGQYGAPNAPGYVPDPLAANNYRFEGGRWKTHRVVWDFRQNGTRTPADVAAFAERTNLPLVAAPDPVRVRTSGATGRLFVEAKDWPVVELDRFEQFTNMIGSDAAADNVTNYGQIGLPAFRNRGGTWGGIQTYGWDTYGDLPWADGYCSGHYDWQGSALNGFLRTRDYKLFTQGRALAQYRRDYGQNHATATTEYWRGAQFYEKGWWHGNYAVGQNSHNWAYGLGLLYVLTGDEGAYEALEENMAYVMRDPPRLWTGYWGDRIPGWAIDALLDGWAFSGKAVYLTEAQLGADRYQVLELADGGGGYHLNPATSPPSTKPWMAAIAFRAIARYSRVSNTSTHVALLGRMRNWLVNSTLVAPTGPVTARTMPHTYDIWSVSGGPSISSTHLAWGHIDALTEYAAKTGDVASYQLSKDLFDMLVRYWQLSPSSPAQNMNSVSGFSKITMRPLQYPVAETKAVGNVLQWGVSHVALRALNEGY